MGEQAELNLMNKVCAGCGKPDAGIEANGSRWCNHCLAARFFSCNHCHNWSDIHVRFTIRNSAGYGKVVCKTCWENHYVKCEHCRYGNRKTDMRIHENHTYCRYCYERMFNCVACRRRLFADQYYDAGLCRSCYEEERKIINPDHLAKPPNEFQGQGPHFYGIELEVECDEKLDRKPNYARQILANFGTFVIVKHDGSIKDKNGKIVGFEIVTIPASRQVQTDKWNIFFDKLPKGLRSYDTKTCGLHIHCARKPLSRLTIAKMLLFVNTKENIRFITTIAGRPPNTYCQIKDKCYKSADPRLMQDRYEALNLANKATVEFRIFRGTLKRESLFKSLEFCDALIHFCKDCCVNVLDSRRVDKFIEYVKINSKEWPHLWAFICARWLGIENKLTKQYGFPLAPSPAEVETYNNEPNPERRPDDEDIDRTLAELDTFDDYPDDN